MNNDLKIQIMRVTEQLAGQGIYASEQREIPYGVQIHFSKGHTSVPIHFYSGKKGITVQVRGSAGPLKDMIKNIVEKPQHYAWGLDMQDGFDGNWIGTDESGKGDFFGPLVVAAVMVNHDTAAQLAELGVRDSKKLSDGRNQKLAAAIRNICNHYFTELLLVPSTYNRLYHSMKNEGKNLNHLLAWAHARVLEDILGKGDCQYALADKFADEKLILSKLMAKGRQVKLVQRPKAEQNVAVAAASILARDRYLEWMSKAEMHYELSLPKGASAMVIDAARKAKGKYGEKVLSEICKMHFKTADSV